MLRRAASPVSRPRYVMRRSVTPSVPRKLGLPVPSQIRACWMIRSNMALFLRACMRLERFNLRQDLSAEQLDFLHHFPVVGAGLLEAQIHHAHTALVMERLELLHDGVGAPYEGQQLAPKLTWWPGCLGAAGSAIAGARVERPAVARREHRLGHGRA